MTPGPDLRQPSTMLERVRPIPGRGAAASPAVESLSEEQQRIIEVLQSQEQGMTARQLQMRLEWPGGRVQPWVDSLVECQLVARLNTVIPSYICR